jgi:hypothetical protein
MTLAFRSAVTPSIVQVTARWQTVLVLPELRQAGAIAREVIAARSQPYLIDRSEITVTPTVRPRGPAGAQRRYSDVSREGSQAARLPLLCPVRGAR